MKKQQVLEKCAIVVVVVTVLLTFAVPGPHPAEASPIVNLLAGRAGRHHQVSRLRDPMPWEDGYFDPTYHSWPKSKQDQAADKQSVKIASEATMTGGRGARRLKSLLTADRLPGRER